MQLLNINYLLIFCVFHLFFNWARVVAIKGQNVRDAVDNEFPFVVAISDVSDDINFERLNSHQFCTGSLITSKHVLTAEHCLLTKEVEKVEVLVGSVNLDLGKAFHPEKWTTYQEWKYKNSCMFPIYHHDVAVITLKECVPDSIARPTIVSIVKPKDLFDTNVRIAGWGETNDNAKPKILRTVDLKVMTKKKCDAVVSQIVQKSYKLLDWHICAKSVPWAFSGCGDSGAPVFNKRNEIVGVLMATCPADEFIPETYKPRDSYVNWVMTKKVNVYADVHYYEKFISYFTKQQSSCIIM